MFRSRTPLRERFSGLIYSRLKARSGTERSVDLIAVIGLVRDWSSSFSIKTQAPPCRKWYKSFECRSSCAKRMHTNVKILDWPSNRRLKVCSDTTLIWQVDVGSLMGMGLTVEDEKTNAIHALVHHHRCSSLATRYAGSVVLGRDLGHGRS